MGVSFNFVYPFFLSSCIVKFSPSPTHTNWDLWEENKSLTVAFKSIKSLDKVIQIRYSHIKASPYFLVGLQAAPVAAFFIHGDLYARNAE